MSYMMGGRGIRYKELRQMRESMSERDVARNIGTALEKGDLRPRDFSIRELAEALVPDGREWVQSLMSPSTSIEVFLKESNEVNSALFANITGQIVFTEIKERYQDEEFVFSKEVESRQSPFLDMEKIPGFGRIGDDVEIVDEGQPYPMLGISEDYIEVGPKKKRGGIVPVTREAIFSDRTGVLLEYAGEIGYWLGLQKEKRIIDAIIDENDGAKSAVLGGHRYHWKGTSYATYQTTSPWDNVTASTALADWTDIEAAWLTLANITDPYTGEPILIQPDTLIVSSERTWVANRIISATEVRSGDITTGSGHQMIGGNPVPNAVGTLKVLTSRLLTARMGTNTDWYLGNPKKAVRHYHNWDIETQQAPAMGPDDFDRDITMKFKASLRDVVSVIEPRVITKASE